MAPTKDPVRFSDLVPTSPIPPAEMSSEERAEFIQEVDAEMDRLGFTEQNETTAASERLTEADFSVRINAR